MYVVPSNKINDSKGPDSFWCMFEMNLMTDCVGWFPSLFCLSSKRIRVTSWPFSHVVVPWSFLACFPLFSCFPETEFFFPFYPFEMQDLPIIQEMFDDFISLNYTVNLATRRSFR